MGGVCVFAAPLAASLAAALFAAALFAAALFAAASLAAPPFAPPALSPASGFLEENFSTTQSFADFAFAKTQSAASSTFCPQPPNTSLTLFNFSLSPWLNTPYFLPAPKAAAVRAAVPTTAATFFPVLLFSSLPLFMPVEAYAVSGLVYACGCLILS